MQTWGYFFRAMAKISEPHNFLMLSLMLRFVSQLKKFEHNVLYTARPIARQISSFAWAWDPSLKAPTSVILDTVSQVLLM